MPRSFAKYEGLGNDFIVLDAAEWSLAEITPALAVALCDRHTGIGADGILWLGPGESPDADARLVIRNADGSRPEMCGNGVRCVAAYLFDRGTLALGDTLRLGTDAGPRPAMATARGPRGSVLVNVDMGVLALGPVVETPVGGRTVRARAVDAGNPHAVVFDAVDEAWRMDLVRALEARREVFPHGVNVEFARVGEARGDQGAAFDVAVHERGVGWTQACGTGACAVAAAAAVERWSAVPTSAREGMSVGVSLAGGALEIAVAAEGDGLRARMKGPARRTFTGAVEPPRDGA